MSERVRTGNGADPDAAEADGAARGEETFDGMRTAAMIFEEGRRIHGALVKLLIEPSLRSYLTAVSRDTNGETPPGDAPEHDARDAQMLELLSSAQHFLMTHPLMAQTAFSALVAEGRRFAATEEGADWQAALEGSTLVRRARQLWSATTLNVLEERRETVVPSAYLELLHWAAEAGEGDLERLIAKLAGSSREDESAA